MPIIYLKIIMVLLVLSLCAIIVMGVRVKFGWPALYIPRFRMPSFDLRLRLPGSGHDEEDEWVSDPDDPAAQRALQLSRSLQEAPDRAEMVSAPESFLEEAMQNLEHAFTSFEAGRIGADTYRSLVRTVRRAAGKRRAGLEARDAVLGADDMVESAELAQAAAAVEASEWCLNWIDDYEQLRVSAKSLFNPPDLEVRPYS